MADLAKITTTLIAGNITSVSDLVQQAIDQGIDPKEILNSGLIAGMAVVGEKMKNGDLFIPEVLRCARAMDAGVQKLKPLLGEGGIQSAGKVVIGTVKGDLHDIGKNLVSMMLESAGFEVVNLGVDASPEAFVKAVQEQRPQIIALSALLTTTMPMMQATIAAVAESGLRDTVKILVGGAPLSQEFADRIGADGYAADAGSAAKLAKTVVN